MKEIRCISCDAVNEWENVDEYKIKPTGMSVCKKCGFVTHLDNIKSPEELKEYYRKDYRQAPSAGNYFSGQRKIHFHSLFLADLFKEWQDGGKDCPIVSDQGAAFGMLLMMIKQFFPKADLRGTELTETMRRVAKHEYGIDLDEDFDDTVKYDLISSYKVAEHQVDADKELRKYAESLKEDGRVYVSVPIWFKYLSNFGASGWDIEYYYHPNHINVWTEKHFEHILNKAGLEVVRKDTRIYDNTYLCKRNDSLIGKEVNFSGDYEKTMENLKKIKTVWELTRARKMKEAVALWPNYPSIYSAIYEYERNVFHKKGYKAIMTDLIHPAIKNTNGHADVLLLASDISIRYEQYQESLVYVEKGLEIRPGNPQFLMMRAQCFGSLAEISETKEAKRTCLIEAIGTLKNLINCSDQSLAEALNWIYKYQSMLEL